MGICRTAWGSRASVICPSNGCANTKSLDLPRIDPHSGLRPAPEPTDPRIGETSDAHPDLHSDGVSTTPVLCFRETEFCDQRQTGQKWRCQSTSFGRDPN